MPLNITVICNLTTTWNEKFTW
uniref:Uncharacterized protein n=1 Tax=Tetranychus urticae TaxID=32264 RepID=T1KWL3_TETUR